MKVRFQPSARHVPEDKQAAKIPYAPAKRPLPRWRWYLTVALVTSPLIYLVFTGAYGMLFLVAPGNVVLKQYLLHATASGYVKRFHAQIGGRSPSAKARGPGRSGAGGAADAVKERAGLAQALGVRPLARSRIGPGGTDPLGRRGRRAAPGAALDPAAPVCAGGRDARRGRRGPRPRVPGRRRREPRPDRAGRGAAARQRAG